MPKPLTSTKSLRALLLLGLLLLGLVGYQVVSSERLTSSRVAVVHTFEVISAAQALDTAIQDAERGQRGFLLVSDEGYLRPYEVDLAVIPQAIGRLHFLTVDNPEQQSRLLILQSHVTIKLDELKRTIDARRAANLDAALAIVRSNVGETSMQAMLSVIADIIETEKVLRRRRLGPPPGDLNGNETILVAEDDDDVRLAVTTMLRDLGYRVLEAINGAAALTILETSERIDMLFTDVVMPGAVTSRALATAARELRPRIKVLYTSGYTENAIVHNGRLDEGVHLISKPYRAEELATKLRAVFRHAAAALDDGPATRREG